MKHILSTITVFFILLTSSVSWTEEVGYGDLRIGSDISVIDEHCEEKESINSRIGFLCYQEDDLVFFFMFDEKNKINNIVIDFGQIYKHSEFDDNLPYPIEDLLNDENGIYGKVRKKLSNKYEIYYDFDEFA